MWHSYFGPIHDLQCWVSTLLETENIFLFKCNSRGFKLFKCETKFLMKNFIKLIDDAAAAAAYIWLLSLTVASSLSFLDYTNRCHEESICIVLLFQRENREANFLPFWTFFFDFSFGYQKSRYALENCFILCCNLYIHYYWLLISFYCSVQTIESLLETLLALLTDAAAVVVVKLLGTLFSNYSKRKIHGRFLMWVTSS